MSLPKTIFILTILSIKCLFISGKIFLVPDYRTYPSYNIDDSNGIRLAVKSAI